MIIELLALQVHITTVFALITTVIVTDIAALLWVAGKKETLSFGLLRTLHMLVWVGLVLMMLSGGTMFLSYREYLLSVPAFYIKMGFVSALVVNAFVIGKHLHIASERSFASLSREERRPLLISGIVSTVSWIGVVSAALMLGL